MASVDVAVVGGGIVGLATAYKLTERDKDIKVAVIEKEPDLAVHQSGRNSGVIHSGIYYKPGSLKAQLCREGRGALIAFCQEHDIPYEICGKVILATRQSEKAKLTEIAERGAANKIEFTRLAPSQLVEIEPHAKAVDALHVRDTGIVNYGDVCKKLADILTSNGHSIYKSSEVKEFKRVPGGILAVTSGEEVKARLVVNCAGAHSDSVAKLAGAIPAVKIVPFRGEYYELDQSVRHLCKHLVYPVPDPRLPFLGVHVTRMINGGVECGPNAVLAFGKESYKWLALNFAELFSTLAYPGFQRVAFRYWKAGLYEVRRSLQRPLFAKDVRELIPEIRAEHLLPARAGIRAQAVRRDGTLLDDFEIKHSDGFIHVLNAPSPAATASLAIGNRLSRLAWERIE